jgi:tRNA(adenine34) deaminase
VTLDERLMGEALALARQGLEEDELPIGAVVALDGQAVASGLWRHSPDGLLDHAEMVALRAAERAPQVRGRRVETTLYTTLEPCLMCLGAAMSFRLGRVVFALEAPLDGASAVTSDWEPALGLPPPGFRIFSTPELVGGVGREEALAIMRSYVDRHAEQAWLQAMLPGFGYR